jgi:hypothetical protein
LGFVQENDAAGQVVQLAAARRLANGKTGGADSTFLFSLNTAGAQFDSHIVQAGHDATARSLATRESGNAQLGPSSVAAESRVNSIATLGVEGVPSRFNPRGRPSILCAKY